MNPASRSRTTDQSTASKAQPKAKKTSSVKPSTTKKRGPKTQTETKKTAQKSVALSRKSSTRRSSSTRSTTKQAKRSFQKPGLAFLCQDFWRQGWNKASSAFWPVLVIWSIITITSILSVWGFMNSPWLQSGAQQWQEMIAWGADVSQGSAALFGFLGWQILTMLILPLLLLKGMLSLVATLDAAQKTSTKTLITRLWWQHFGCFFKTIGWSAWLLFLPILAYVFVFQLLKIINESLVAIPLSALSYGLNIGLLGLVLYQSIVILLLWGALPYEQGSTVRALSRKMRQAFHKNLILSVLMVGLLVGGMNLLDKARQMFMESLEPLSSILEEVWVMTVALLGGLLAQLILVLAFFVGLSVLTRLSKHLLKSS